VKPATTTDYYTRGPIQLPLAIAEIGIPGVVRGQPRRSISTGCRNDLVQLDGAPVPVAVTGDIDRAIERGALDLVACGPVELAPGEHRITTARGSTTGFDVDRLIVSSTDVKRPSWRGGSAGDIGWERTSRSGHRVDVPEVDTPSWLVLGESWSPGWSARAGDVDLGEPVLVNGYANGWMLERTVASRATTYEIQWMPQRVVTIGLVTSLVGAVACVVLLVLGRSSRCAAVVDEPDWADWTDPTGRRDPPRGAAIVASSAVAGAFAAMVASPAHGVVLVALTASALLLRHGRWVTMGVALVSAALCAGGTFAIQMRNAYPPGFGWAENFDRLHPIGWMVFLALGVEVGRVLVRPEPARTPRTGNENL
jgi:arabinofuranan 3-O-arabinosyltransferase